MCGVVSIYSYSDSAPDVDHHELCAIRDHMAARGPDGKGEWRSEKRRVGLAHRRLAIIDPEERASQPMLSAHGKLAIVFNGEIYNFRALRADLEQLGHEFLTESDTEVLLHLFAEKRERMLPELRGMFAFIIWDSERKQLFMARDSYGIKPLYYADDGRTLRAASQVKALLTGGKVAQATDPAGIAGFHLFGSVPEPFTLYRQIRQVPAGHYLFADEHGAGEPQRWFSIAETYTAAKSAALQVEGIQQTVREALLDSVRDHLVADVPVGAFLSAGIDSGSLVGLMRDAGASNIQTVTLAFDEFTGTSNDESPLAEQVAQQYDTLHVTRRVGREEFEQDLPKILQAMDQPSIDGINTWFVSKAAAEQGLKVAVSGLGGDELFGGYPSFRDIPRWVYWFRAPGAVPLLGKIARKLLTPLAGPLGFSPKAAGMLELGGNWVGAYLMRRGLFMPWELPGLLGDELAQEGLRRLKPLNWIAKAIQPCPDSDFARVASLESALYMRNQLLRDADWAGMAHSLEIRVPLVDAQLLAALSTTAVTDTQWSKQRLASAPSTPVPVEISSRAKTGFTTPVAEWQAPHNRHAPGRGLRPWSRTVFEGLSHAKTPQVNGAIGTHG